MDRKRKHRFTRPESEKQILGKGTQPTVVAFDNQHLVCLWESDNFIHASFVKL